MAGVVKKIVGEITLGKAKGKKLKAEIGKKLSPKAIANYKC